VLIKTNIIKKSEQFRKNISKESHSDSGVARGVSKWGRTRTLFAVI